MLTKASPCERCFTDLILFNPTSPCHVGSMASSSLLFVCLFVCLTSLLKYNCFIISVLQAGCLGLRKVVALAPVTWRTVAELNFVLQTL